MRNLTLLCLALPELAVCWGGSREQLLMEGKLALTLTPARGMTGWREVQQNTCSDFLGEFGGRGRMQMDLNSKDHIVL